MGVEICCSETAKFHAKAGRFSALIEIESMRPEPVVAGAGGKIVERDARRFRPKNQSKAVRASYRYRIFPHRLDWFLGQIPLGVML